MELKIVFKTWTPAFAGATKYLHKSIPACFSFLAIVVLSCSPRAKNSNPYDKSKIDLTPANGGTYIEASIADANVLNPVLATDSASGDINSKVYNSLIKYDKNIEIVGEMAESWTFSNGGKTITFKLKDGIRWHDGKPFSSADVMFTYQTLISSLTRTPYGSDYMLVQKAEAPDPLTFRVTYGKSFAPALESWGMGIIAKHIYEKGDINTHPANRIPIGTGPYKFKEWITDQKIVLTANDDYFDGRPHFEKFVYYILPDQSIQFLELRQGTLSIMSPTPDQYNGYDEFFTLYDKYRYPAFSYDYLAFNLTLDIFKDKKVRHAIGHAVNKENIIQGIYQGLAVPATGPFPPSSWAYNSEIKSLDYDPARAEKLLAEAGWRNKNSEGILMKEGKPFEFTLVTNNGNDVRKMMSEIIQNDLKKVGIKMEIRLVEWSVFITKYIDDRAFDATLLGWNLSRDPDSYSIWHSSQKGKGQYNFVSYHNEEVDRLLIQGRETVELNKRKEIYKKIHALIADDAPYIFLTNPESRPVVHKKIMGVEKAPIGIGHNFEKWFIPKPWQEKTHLAS